MHEEQEGLRARIVLFPGPQHGRWYADRLPHGELTVVPGGGHLFPVACWAAILEAALR
jgi:pimeloyl-ACP methyl ester carboxylesterase